MKYLFRIIKILIVSTLTIFLVSVTASYLLLNIPSVQQKVTHLGEKELSKLLDTRLTIGKGHVFPFNKIQLSDVCLYDKAIRYYMPKNSLLDLPGRNYCKNDWFSRLYNFMISKFLFKKRIPIPRSTCNLSSIASRRTNHRPSTCIPKSIRYSPVGEK